ncbi:MAG: DNA-directed RNA polymerase subunit alpha C-terminal domain-containing protein [Patescibacteria group bacterium]|jgi:DNA-directed RNA polymerase alpha subunit
MVNIEILEKKVKDLGLSTRAYLTLRHLEVVTVLDLLRKTRQELLHCKNFSWKSWAEVEHVLADLGLELKPY